MGSSPTPGSRIIVRWQRGRLHRSAKPKAQAHAGPNPARTSSFPTSTRKEMAMKALIEVRPGEGGEDAKLLVREQSRMYLRYAEKNGLRADIEERGGL